MAVAKDYQKAKNVSELMSYIYKYLDIDTIKNASVGCKYFYSELVDLVESTY